MGGAPGLLGLLMYIRANRVYVRTNGSFAGCYINTDLHRRPAFLARHFQF